MKNFKKQFLKSTICFTLAASIFFSGKLSNLFDSFSASPLDIAAMYDE
ncbi:MAG: hypothetical protein HFH41_09025 [Lachnospiraceae bacterium]|nr:hypothetical protein [Lachnospiraceae bacterium]